MEKKKIVDLINWYIGDADVTDPDGGWSELINFRDSIIPNLPSPIVSDQEKDTAIDYEKKLIQVMIYDELLGFVNRENRESMPRRMFSHFANALTDKILSIIEKERNYIEKCKSFIDKCSNEMGEKDAKIQELQREIEALRARDRLK